MRAPEAYVPKPARAFFSGRDIRKCILAGMRYRRSRRFALVYKHRDRNGNVVAVEPLWGPWLDLGGEGG